MVSKLLKSLTLLFLVGFVGISTAFAVTCKSGAMKKIQVCVDENPWKPYIHAIDKNGTPKVATPKEAVNAVKKGGKITGIYTDLSLEAFKCAGLDPVLTLLPWKRCEGNAKKGKDGATLVASYKEKRLGFFEYPPGAEKTSELTPQRVGAIAYMLVCRKDNPFVYDGKNLKGRNIGGIRGYSINGNIKDQGGKIQEVKSHKNNVDKLKKKRIDCFVAINSLAEVHVKANPGLLKKQETPVKVKNYFVVFPPKGNVTDELIIF